MPRFLERKLKEKYGADSDIPYEIMNKLGFMKGSKKTAKGHAAEEKHESKTASQGDPKDPKFHGQIDDKTKAKMINKLKGFSTK